MSEQKSPRLDRPDGGLVGEDRARAGAVRDGGACCTPVRQRGWLPELLPADTPAKRRVDKALPRAGWPVVAYFAAVFVLVNLAPHLPTRAGLVVMGFGALGGGAWCALNFWRCRHAHCVVSGTGWLALAMFSFGEAILGRSVIAGDEGLVFLGVLAAAMAFEGGWFATHRTNAVRAVARRR